MFAKPLKEFTSEFELTEEEKEAVAKSKQRLLAK
jgi:phosphotransferase system HPr-like phosphotransfer protein